MKLFDNKYGLLFAIFGVILQFIAFYYTEVSLLALISGVTGIFAVVLCAERKLSFWIFAWIQLITYLILAYQQKLWGEVGENIFYAITMIYGMFIWYKYSNNSSKVISKSLSRNKFSIINTLCIIGIIVLWKILDNTNDSQPFLDSVTTVPAIIAQILMILAYKEQWLFWLIIDIASIYMWIVAGNWCMVSQFVFWTLNCIYGYINWSKTN